MSGHTPWAVVKVRARRRQGWEAWLAPTRVLLWARIRKDNPSVLDVETIAPDELEVLDEVLREEG